MVLGHWDGPDLGPGGSVQQGDTDLIKQHKLVGFELYNIKNDPMQSQDLAGSEPERLDRLARKLREKYTQIQTEGRSWDK